MDLETSKGLARAHMFGSEQARVTLVMSHGAGGGVQAPDLQAIADQLPGDEVRVVLLEQPWRVAGKRVAPAPATLDVAWREALAQIPVPGRFIVGGRSAGARVACRTAADVGADAVVALAFPLHPPGKPEKSRAAELAVRMPLLIVQGERDPFGRPAEFGVPVVAVPGDHSLRSGLPEVVTAVRDFVAGL